MEATGPSFTYTPLACALKFPILKSLSIKAFNYDANPLAIRLLRLLPSSDFHSEIHVAVFHAILETSQSYEALSYVWGDPDNVKAIRVNEKRHHVTVNLELAMRHLRDENEERIMWIDALCINQQDLEEKNYQVQRMREIYLQAKKVIISLSEERNAQLALDFCHKKDRSLSVIQGKQHVQITAEIDACVDLFVTQPWWNRIWTVQEVYHENPVEFRIGMLSVDFSVMHEYYRYFYLNVLSDGTPNSTGSYPKIFPIGSLPQPVIWGKQKLIEERNVGKEKLEQSLSSLLQKTRGIQASDPRDKIFALRGLVRDKEIIKADYTASKHDVLINLTLEILRNDWSTLEDVLLSVESVDRDPDLPSWIPDFGSRQRAIPLVMRYWARHFKAASFQAEKTFYEKELQLRGFIIGFILEVHRTALVDSVIQDDELKQFSLMRYEKIKDRYMDDFGFLPYNTRTSYRNIGWQSPSWSGGVGGPEPTYLDSSWAPYSTEEHDLICVVGGCRLPLILRKESRKNKFRIVGACFLIDSTLGARPDFANDEGFSNIIRGRIWDLQNYEIRPRPRPRPQLFAII